MRLIDADALKDNFPNARADIFENCRNCTCLDNEQINQIIDSAPTIGGWISVKDRLPENAGRYLVSAIENSRFTHVTIAQYNRHFILSGYRAYWRITHWMPLPESPKEDTI